MTRLLHDRNDDCGDRLASRCRGTHDLIALDIDEREDDEGRPGLVFVFTMDRGGSGTLTDTLTFAVDGRLHEFVLETRDGTVSGTFDDVQGPRPLGDGTRFQVEAFLAWEMVGARPGSSLNDFAVASTHDGVAGDIMPGGYYGADGELQVPPEGDHPTAYARQDYTVGSPARDAAGVAAWAAVALMCACIVVRRG